MCCVQRPSARPSTVSGRRVLMALLLCLLPCSAPAQAAPAARISRLEARALTVDAPRTSAEGPRTAAATTVGTGDRSASGSSTGSSRSTSVRSAAPRCRVDPRWTRANADAPAASKRPDSISITIRPSQGPSARTGATSAMSCASDSSVLIAIAARRCRNSATAACDTHRTHDNRLSPALAARDTQHGGISLANHTGPRGGRPRRPRLHKIRESKVFQSAAS